MEKYSEISKTKFGEDLSLMYQRFVLDCICDLGLAISMDFSQKPHLYIDVDSIAKELIKFQCMINVDPNLPGKEIREKLYHPIFGISETSKTSTNNSTFKMLRNKLFEAAASYAENAQPFQFAALRIDVINAIAAPRDHFEGLQGTSINITKKRIKRIFNISTKILMDPKIMMRFGIDGTFTKAENKEEKEKDVMKSVWPLEEINPIGSKLIYEISNQLKDISGGIIERQEFVRMQRIAQRGSIAIKMLIDTDLDTIPNKLEQDDPKVLKLNEFIGNLYAWGRDLGVIGSKRNLSNISPK